MALGGRLVVDLARGEGEAVMDAGIKLDLARAPGFGEMAAQRLDHRQRREMIVLGAGDVELAAQLTGSHFGEGEMRALDRVADQPGAVERGGGGDALGKP